MFLLAWYRRTTARSWKKFSDSLVAGFNTVPDTGVVIVMAGILVGVLDLTGVGIRMTGGLAAIAGGNLFLLLLLTAVAALILGMGMPTSAVYLLVAMLLAPALIKVGMLPLVAHFAGLVNSTLAMRRHPTQGIATHGPEW